jgi:hypothetical protein
MMNNFIHWLKPPFLVNYSFRGWNLDENLLGGGSNCNIVNHNPQKNHKEWQLMLGWHLVSVTVHHNLQLVLSETLRIGDTTYHF